jgi:hypothetical protein
MEHNILHRGRNQPYESSSHSVQIIKTYQLQAHGDPRFAASRPAVSPPRQDFISKEHWRVSVSTSTGGMMRAFTRA